MNEDELYQWLNSDEEENEQVEKPELLTVKLFKRAILETDGNESDRILQSFAENVLPNLIYRLVGATAKGGQFTEDRRAEGKNVERSKHDQSFISHLLNGLLPTYRIAKALRESTVETNPVKRNCSEREVRLFVAAYILHDFDKFPDYPIWLQANDPDNRFEQRDWRKDPPHKHEAPNFGRNYVLQKAQEFGLDRFLGDNWESEVNDIVWLAHNAGDKYDADLGLDIRGLQTQLDGRVRGTLANLVKLSDRFASVIKHPSDIDAGSLPSIIGDLSNHQLKFSYHSLSDNRGVLTNIINNTLIDMHLQENYTPLLYLPDGVVYLVKADATQVKTQELPEQAIQKIKTLCAERLKQRTIGFSRDGKGFKFADYYWLFFNTIELMEVSVDAACKLISSTKASSAQKRSESLQNFQKSGELSSEFKLEFQDDYRIDRLAEFGDVICRKVWGEWQNKFNNYQKQLSKNVRQSLPELDLTHKLAEYLGLAHELVAVRAIQSLKKTGGVPLDWYYLAAKYIELNKGLEDNQVRQKMTDMVCHAAHCIQPIVGEFTLADGWDDLRTYVSWIVSLPTGAVNKPEIDPFLIALSRYNAAKITGRGRENVCAMSSSSFTVTEQMESATLFAPQVYSNRQILFNAQAAKRQICSIWSIEIMLRQILMNQTNATGGDFESRKYRYLYLYPAYFFTPETNKFLQKAYAWIARTRFDADIRKHLVSDQQVANFTANNYQQVDSLLIQEDLQPENDRTFKISYPPNQPLTFFFLALPPGKDATDTESWVMPAWLALALPLILDVKAVVSESPVPPYISGADFEKTTILDGEHQAIRSLIQQDEYRLDRILSRERGFSPLNALSAAYCIHLEVNRKKDGNPDWGKLSDLARDLETSPLYVFHYLSKLVRKLDWDTAPIAKIQLYQYFYSCFDPKGKAMNQLRELTQLYRRFYRAKSQFAKPNAVLKPIDEAADVILKVDKALANDTQSLTDVVAARIAKLMTNVRRKTAEGKPTFTLVDGKWKPALNSEEERQAVYEFAKYFVEVIFAETFKGDRARLAGMQLNLIRDTCDYLYRLEEDREWRDRKAKGIEVVEEEDAENDESNP
ncbi:type I-D CRISPR-associated protein Cas10d/Csc3 [Kamptonema cortianum]|uniref:Type I-D CRISPR-associated protein Cas10d/Csc3 n=1 Tax=Geitlerinema calcuttense NRMC-F 0142 TaxID=2922238 RepID=A0ABT7M0F9_9CYAN|nr:type I-D CRISPR-associated protein Cas10d/Csc3 [Geitlerinema calcuttense]MDK3159156.1 type I-D CRISPR-associated protein Cas10d/Csc3 [Kamptonema cortianum]MDL5057738.1 type I-D CRISPR-associated protein Cas10d/Csc3 [Geitlerinema calcuttense NRMC-F 0142]